MAKRWGFNGARLPFLVLLLLTVVIVLVHIASYRAESKVFESAVVQGAAAAAATPSAAATSAAPQASRIAETNHGTLRLRAEVPATAGRRTESGAGRRPPRPESLAQYGRQPTNPEAVRGIPADLLSSRDRSTCFHFCIIFARYALNGIWQDGFGAATELLSEHHFITWEWVVDRRHVTSAECLAADYLWVKSDFSWFLDEWARASLGAVQHKVSLLQSGITPPNAGWATWYHSVFYETAWFKETFGWKFVGQPRHYQAFGISTRIMHPGVAPLDEESKPFEYVFVGHISDALKRVRKLEDMPGRRLAIGHVDAGDMEVVKQLRAHGVDVVAGQMSYDDLATILRLSRTVLLPMAVWGGGERALLEARACGAAVEISTDNPKLKSLLELPVVPNECLYAQQLLRGFAAATQREVVGVDGLSAHCVY